MTIELNGFKISEQDDNTYTVVLIEDMDSIEYCVETLDQALAFVKGVTE